MVSQFIKSTLLILSTSISAFGQAKSGCDTVLALKLSVGLTEVVENIKRCGWLSGDDTLLLQGPILAPQLLLLANNKTATYGDLVAKLYEIRQLDFYPLLLQTLKQGGNSMDNVVDSRPATISFSKMEDYQLAVDEAVDNHKPLFLYFTSKNSVDSRRMEKGLLADYEVKSILSKYVRYVADTDDADIANLQIERFQSDVIPYFVVVIDNKKVAEFFGLGRDKEQFIAFLEKGLK